LDLVQLSGIYISIWKIQHGTDFRSDKISIGFQPLQVIGMHLKDAHCNTITNPPFPYKPVHNGVSRSLEQFLHGVPCHQYRIDPKLTQIAVVARARIQATLQISAIASAAMHQNCGF